MKKEELLQIAKRYRLRLTKTREALLDVLLSTRTPLSVPRLLDELACRGISVNKTTVYRELERLEQIGIVKSVSLQDRKQYFELATRDHHHHFVCTMCHAITDVEINEASIMAKAEQIGRRLGFHITTHAVEFYGQCASCVMTFSSRQSV